MTTRDLVLSALFTAIIVALGVLPPIPIALLPVPITAQFLGVMMAGVVLGANRGAISVLILLLLVAIGLPVLSGGRGGLSVFAGPTAGYLVGFLPAAYLTGLIAERMVNEEQATLVQIVGFFLAAVIGGVLVDHALGVVYLGLAGNVGLSKAFIGDLVFIPGDILKAIVAAVIGRTVMIGYPLLPRYQR